MCLYQNIFKIQLVREDIHMEHLWEEIPFKVVQNLSLSAVCGREGSWFSVEVKESLDGGDGTFSGLWRFHKRCINYQKDNRGWEILKINCGFFEVDHRVMCRQSFKLSYVFLDITSYVFCHVPANSDYVPFIYSSHLFVLIRLLLILTRFVGTLWKEPFLNCFSSLANFKGKLNNNKKRVTKYCETPKFLNLRPGVHCESY